MIYPKIILKASNIMLITTLIQAKNRFEQYPEGKKAPLASVYGIRGKYKRVSITA